jgi:hypothetical protein
MVTVNYGFQVKPPVSETAPFLARPFSTMVNQNLNTAVDVSRGRRSRWERSGFDPTFR